MVSSQDIDVGSSPAGGIMDFKINDLVQLIEKHSNNPHFPRGVVARVVEDVDGERCIISRDKKSCYICTKKLKLLKREANE